MTTRKYFSDWLQTESGAIASQAVKAHLNAVAIAEGLTESEVVQITDVTIEAMSTAYDAGFRGGLDHSSANTLNKESI